MILGSRTASARHRLMHHPSTVPNIDPSTGNRDPHIPYKPMQKYRQVDEIYNKMGKPCFGVLAALKEGTTKEGTFLIRRVSAGCGSSADCLDATLPRTQASSE